MAHAAHVPDWGGTLVSRGKPRRTAGHRRRPWRLRHPPVPTCPRRRHLLRLPDRPRGAGVPVPRCATGPVAALPVGRSHVRAAQVAHLAAIQRPRPRTRRRGGPGPPAVPHRVAGRWVRPGPWLAARLAGRRRAMGAPGSVVLGRRYALEEKIGAG